MSAAETRPVQLQINTNGAWKTVARFDVGDGLKVAAVQQAACDLHQVDTRTDWRIATAERHPAVLMCMGHNTSGLWMKAEVAQ